MTGRASTTEHTSPRPKRPSVVALLLLFIGAWASIATSPVESSVDETGEHIITADQPVFRLSWQATSDESPELLRTDLWWDVTTATGAPAELSVAFPDKPSGTIQGGLVRRFNGAAASGTVEFVVTNLAKTGDVTIAWNAQARVEADQAELAMNITSETDERASARASVPLQTRFLYDERQIALVYHITATVPASSAGSGGEAGLSLELDSLDQLDRPQDVLATVLVGGEQIGLSPSATIPWPTDCGATCELTAQVVMASPPGLTADTNDPDGTVTIVASEPFESAPVTVELGPAPMFSKERTYLLDVDLPVGDPLDRQVVITATLNDQDDESFCSLPVSFQVADGGLQGSAVYLGGSWDAQTPAVLERGGELVEVLLGPTGNPEECEGRMDENVSVTIGVITFGVTPPAPATVTVR